MSVDVGRGMRRLSLAFLGVVWVFVLSVGSIDTSGHWGRTIGYTLIFTVVYLVFCRVVAWVYAGFKRG